MKETDVEEVFRDAVGAIDVHAPSVESVVAESRAHKHHRQRQVLASVGSAAAVLSLVAWWGTRPGSEAELAAVVVIRAENPAEIVWWANDVLHLDEAAMALPGVTDLAEVTGGAVYTDVGGAVVLVDEEGARSRLGTEAPYSRLAVSGDRSRVAWVDAHEGAPELVVYDVTSREALARISVPNAADPIALDQDKAFFATPHGDYAVVLSEGDAVVRDGYGLLDVASQTRVRQAGAEAIMMAPFFNISYVRPGVGAQLSPDGNHVLTRIADARSAYGTVHIYDTRSGVRVPTGLTDADLALGARFGPAGTVTYVVARAEDEPQADEFVRLSFSGTLDLRTCSLFTGECEVEAKFSGTGATPVLSR